jgi:hypothetical protein
MIARQLALCLIGTTLTVAAPAAAELPPYVYEQARREADTVLVLTVSELSRLAQGETEGACRLTGRVDGVERGEAPAAGQTVNVDLPCVSKDYTPMPGPFPGYDQDALGKVAHVRVWLKDGALVRRGLDVID